MAAEVSVPIAAAAPRRRLLGLGALFSASIGVIVAEIGMVGTMQGIGIGGAGFLWAMAIAFVLALLNAMAYAEMSLMMPSAGSLSRYAEAAIGNFPAILLVFAGYVTPAIFGLPAELILADQILTQSVPLALPPLAWPVALVVLFAALNILGTDVFARVQTALTFVMLAFFVATGAVALGGMGAAPLPAGPNAGLAALGRDSSTIGLIALAFWLFVGSEFVTPLVTEAGAPGRDLPRAMIGGLVTIFAAFVLFSLGAAFYVPREQLSSSATPHMDYAVAVWGPGARIWFAAFALVATASLLNTVLAAVPRMLYGMACNGQVFPIFKRVHRTRGTPVVAIVFVAALPLIGLAWSRGDAAAIVPLAVAASVAWLLAYIMAQVSLVVLRVRHPRLNRPFRMPGCPWLPLVAIAGMVYVIANSAPTPEMAPQIARYTGYVLALFAVVGAVWVRVFMRRGLFEPRPPE
jgi:amino acid transporter